MPRGKLVILYLRISDACIVFPVRLEIHRYHSPITPRIQPFRAFSSPCDSPIFSIYFYLSFFPIRYALLYAIRLTTLFLRYVLTSFSIYT